MKGALVAWSWSWTADRLCKPLCYWRARLNAVMSLKLFIFLVQVQRLELIRSEEFERGIVGRTALCGQHLQARQERVCRFNSHITLSPHTHTNTTTLFLLSPSVSCLTSFIFVITFFVLFMHTNFTNLHLKQKTLVIPPLQKGHIHNPGSLSEWVSHRLLASSRASCLTATKLNFPSTRVIESYSSYHYRVAMLLLRSCYPIATPA